MNLRLLIVGTGRLKELGLPRGIHARLLRSSRECGPGRWRSALAALRGGTFDAVYVLRWVGHSEMEALKQVSAGTNTPVIWVSGGLTSLKRLLCARLSATTRSHPV